MFIVYWKSLFSQLCWIVYSRPPWFWLDWGVDAHRYGGSVCGELCLIYTYFGRPFLLIMFAWQLSRLGKGPQVMVLASSTVSLEVPARQLCFRWSSNQHCLFRSWRLLWSPLKHFPQAASPGRDNGALDGEERGPIQGQTKKARLDWSVLYLFSSNLNSVGSSWIWMKNNVF